MAAKKRTASQSPLLPFELTSYVKGERLEFKPFFCPNGDPFENIVFTKRDAVIRDAKGTVVFEQKGVEAPETWSDRAVNIVAEKYFRYINGVKETSVKQLVTRVAETIASAGLSAGLFNDTTADVFQWELMSLLVNQMFAFNSPVWFNIGVPGVPQQASACFINSVVDTMDSITDLAKTEVILFKGGSGAGSNLSRIRSSYEKLSGGGTASGPVSFMKMLDAGAGVTKSGGTTRRAALMRVLDVDHPDILEQANGQAGFITCKSEAERIAQALITAGFSAEFNKPGNAYDHAPYQNANNSVRVTDEFMQAVGRDDSWETRERVTQKPVHKYSAKQLFRRIAEAAWASGDPGLQFDTTINAWHTLPNIDRIRASNPCQPDFATVLTPEGVRTFADIDVGSTIWSGKQWTKVKRKISTGVKPVFEYRTTAGAFVGTEEHVVISNGERVQVKDAESLDRASGPAMDPTEFDTAWVLSGLVFGDGRLVHANGGRQKYPILYVGVDDQDYFTDAVSKFIAPSSYDATAYRVEGCLLHNDELDRRITERALPTRIRALAPREARSFLRGLYSANGSIAGNRVTLKATCFETVVAVQQMLSALGIVSYYTTNGAHEVTFANGTYLCKESYDLNITQGRALFRDLIGFIQKDKQGRLLTACTETGSGRTKTSFEVKDVQALGSLPVWDIEVEAEEHTYWTGGMLVSNCSEFMHLDNTSCNLGSFNLLKFYDSTTRTFQREHFDAAVKVAITAMEILVGYASYPTEDITAQTRASRPLGIGYANLGALLMHSGLAYDSLAGRNLAAAITSYMSSAAYYQSSLMAEVLGPFKYYRKNAASVSAVLRQHAGANAALDATVATNSVGVADLVTHAGRYWDAVVDRPVRNSQISVLAPTGTIGFMMDCDTTGIEPLLALVQYKKLVGGGMLKMPTASVRSALESLGYSQPSIAIQLTALEMTGELDRQQLAVYHLPVFQTAIGADAIAPLGHLKMMAAVQPFISGAISKTVNMPNSATVDDVEAMYFEAWRLKLKAVAIYRDGCKQSQPVSAKKTAEEKPRPLPVDISEASSPELIDETLAAAKTNGDTVFSEGAPPTTHRRRLLDTRRSVTHKFSVGGQEGYFHVGLHADGTPGELFVNISKAGSTLHGLVDMAATAISMGLQYGVPLMTLLDKYRGQRFDPSGFTSNPAIPRADSIADYLARWMEAEFCSPPRVGEAQSRQLTTAELSEALSKLKGVLDAPETPPLATMAPSLLTVPVGVAPVNIHGKSSDLSGAPCSACGNLTQRAGSCYVCTACGTTTGCG